MALHEPFRHLQHKLWSKEQPGVKLLNLKKVGNQPDLGVCRWSATHCWKALEESYKFPLNLIPIQGLSQELWAPKVLGVQTGIVSRFLLESHGNKNHLDCGGGGATLRILYGGRWWLPPNPGRGESSESMLPMACPNTKGVSQGDLTLLWLVFMQDQITK